MFSATFPTEIQRIASKYLDNYLYVVVGMVGGACSDVTQEFLQVAKFDKRKKLIEILKSQSMLCSLKLHFRDLTIFFILARGTKIIVFVETKKTADFLAALLSDSQLSSTSIHGDRFQEQREAALKEFRTGKRDILVATNVAARGLGKD